MSQPVIGGENTQTTESVIPVDQRYFDYFPKGRRGLTIYRSPDDIGNRVKESNWMVINGQVNGDNKLLLGSGNKTREVDVRLLFKWNMGIDIGAVFTFEGNKYFLGEMKGDKFKLTTAIPDPTNPKLFRSNPKTMTYEELMLDDKWILLPKNV